MLLIPLGDESREVRRQPWLTYLFVALCLVVFHQSSRMDAALVAQGEERLAEAWDFFVQRPWVEVAPDVAQLLGEDDVERVKGVHLQEESAYSSVGVPEFVLDHDQLEFDRKIDAAFEVFASHPHYRWGFDPAEPVSLTILSHPFLHAGWIHLVVNLVLILLVGLLLEDAWGLALFGALLIGSALAGGLAYMSAEGPGAPPLIGAAGIASGLLGAYLVRFATARMRFAYFVPPFITGQLTATAWLLVPFAAALLGLVEWQGEESEFANGTTAYSAHLGGLAFGFGFGLFMRAGRIAERFVDPRLERRSSVASNPTIDEALELAHANQPEQAFELLAAEVRDRPANLDACLALWDVASACGRAAEASEAVVRVLRHEIRSSQAGLVVQHWQELATRTDSFEMEASLVVHIADVLAAEEKPELATDALRRVLDGRHGAVSPSVAVRIARAARHLDPAMASEAAAIALDSDGLDPADLAELEALVHEMEPGRAAGASTPSPAAPDPPPERSAFDFDTEADLSDPNDRTLPPGDGPALDLESAPARPTSGSDGLDDIFDPHATTPEALADRSSLDDTALDATSANGPGAADAGPEEWLRDVDPGSSEPEPPSIDAPFYVRRSLQVAGAVPIAIGDGSMTLDVEGRGKQPLELSRIEAVAVGGVRGLQAKPVVVVDLILNWLALGGEPLEVLRLRSDRFDPRRLAEAASPVDALRALLGLILSGSHATELPDRDAALGDPFRFFASLADYEREVLNVEGEPCAADAPRDLAAGPDREITK